MDINAFIRMRNALKRLKDTLDKGELVAEKELTESLETWTLHSEQVVHLLNQQKMALRKEELTRFR